MFYFEHTCAIHLSIFYTHLIELRFAGGLETIQAVIRREAGYTLDRSSVYSSFLDSPDKT